MRHRLLTLVAVVLVVVGVSVVITSNAASAHNQNQYTEFYCAEHTAGPYWTVVHSIIDFYNEDYVRVYCIEGFFDVKQQYWVLVAYPWGHSNTTWDPWEHQRLQPNGPFPQAESA